MRGAPMWVRTGLRVCQRAVRAAAHAGPSGRGAGGLREAVEIFRRLAREALRASTDDIAVALWSTRAIW